MSERVFTIGQPVWIYSRGVVQKGVVRAVGTFVADTYRVESGRHNEIELGMNLYARPQDVERLIAEIERNIDYLGEEIRRLRTIEENQS